MALSNRPKPSPRVILAACLTALIRPGPATAAEGAPHLDGAALGLPWVLPFAAMLLSIALMPLLAPRFWHHNFGRISAFWAL